MDNSPWKSKTPTKQYIHWSHYHLPTADPSPGCCLVTLDSRHRHTQLCPRANKGAFLMNTAVHNIVSTEHNPQCTAHLSVIQIICMPKPIHEHKYLNVDTDTLLHTLKTLSVGPLHCAVTVNYCCWFKVIVSKIIGECISNSLMAMAVKQKEKNELPWPCCSVGGGVMLTTLCCHYT